MFFPGGKLLYMVWHMSWTIEDVQLPSRREDPVGDDVWISALRHGGMAEFSWADPMKKCGQLEIPSKKVE